MWFSGVAQPLRKGFQYGVVMCGDEGGLEQDMPPGTPSSGNGPFATCRDLPRHETEPCGEIAPFAKTGSSADSGHERRRNCRAHARDLHQPLHIGIRLGQSLDLNVNG